MSSGVPINSARRTVTFGASALAVANGIKTSFASVASPVTLVVTDFNGANIDTNGTLKPTPRTVTITRSNNAGQFSTGAIVVTGKRGPNIVTETLTPATADGNDTLRGTQAFDRLTSIAKPADGGTGGTYTIGVQDICAQHDDVFTGVELAASGTLNVQYAGANTDAIPIATALVGVIKPIAPRRILTSPALATPTTVGLTVYLP